MRTAKIGLVLGLALLAKGSGPVAVAAGAADGDSVAAAGTDSATSALPSRERTVVEIRPDSSFNVPPDTGKPPWASLATPGDTLFLYRDEVERTGAHLPLELLALIPGTQALEASATAPAGALFLGGSFAAPEITSDGWLVRLPRLEGRDLSHLLLDRLGPGPALIPLAGPGDLLLTHEAGSISGMPVVHFFPAEPVADSSHSRVAVYHSGSSLTGGGVVLSDRRGPVYYGLGLDNTGAGALGGVSDVSTRLAMIDAGGVTSWGRVAMSLRATESAIEWKNARRLKHDDQGAALEAIAGDTLGPAWSLRFSVLDDRLSGSDLPGREFRRKGGRVDARWWPRPPFPAWLRLVGERDWLAVRFPGGVFAPRVNRGQIEGGAELAAGGLGRLHGAATLRASDRHPPRPGGRVAIERPLAGKLGLGAGVSRVYRPPTLDQEVLVGGQPPAEPERHDAAELWLTHQASLHADLLITRRWLAHQPVVLKETSGERSPEFEFETNELEHWELRVLFSSPTGPLGLAAGLWGSRFFPVGGTPSLPAFASETLGRAFVTLDLDLLHDALVLRPRLEALVLGEYRDFAERRVGGHTRLDATLVAVVGRQVDLELRVRNALDRRYPLAVLDSATDELLLDSGRLILIGIRWRLIH